MCPLTTTPGSARKSWAVRRPRASSQSRLSGRIWQWSRVRMRRIGRRGLTGMAVPPGREAGQKVLGGGHHLGGGQLRHAPVVERADAELARAARHLLLEVD